MYTDWQWIGDVNIENGGKFIRHDVNDHGFPYFSEIIEVIDLESATGAEGLTALNFMSTFDYEDKHKVDNALSCWGEDQGYLRKRGKSEILNILADAFSSYGYADPWEEYYLRPSYIVLVNDNYGRYSDRGSWDGWNPDKDETVKLHKQYGGDLEAYIKGEWM